MSGQGGNQQWQAGYGQPVGSGPAPINYPTSVGPNQYWGSQNQFGGGGQTQGGQPLWQNPFSPMGPGDWAALEDKYFPPPPGPGPPPEPGTIEHYKTIGGSPRDNTGSRGYANYMSAMATLHGTPVQARNTGGEGGHWMVGTQEVNDSVAYEWEGQIHNKHRGAIDWAKGEFQRHGGGPGEMESMFGPSQNPGFVESFSQAFQNYGVENWGMSPQRALEVFGISGPGWGGGRSTVGNLGTELGSVAGIEMGDTGVFGGIDMGDPPADDSTEGG